MKQFILLISTLVFFSVTLRSAEIPKCYNEVDQVLWIVSDVESTIANYKKLGFSQIKDLGQVEMESEINGNKVKIRLVCANLAGARVNWVQPLNGKSVFQEFLRKHGDGAISLVHRFSAGEELKKEIGRLEDLGIHVLDDLTIRTGNGDLKFVLMDTQREGKYCLGFTYGESGLEIHQALGAENRNDMKLSQYAFAIRDPEPVSAFWHKLGLPEFQIDQPVLGEPRYYGEVTDHELMQGWQRHGSITYEWCIPLKPPIVYEDHIQRHGEGIHHLAFMVKDMDEVLEDYTSRGYVVSMGGTWGEKGKPGSGRYEYIDLEEAGGLTMELLWSFIE